ncbi:MAG: hypothetical protein LBU32_07635 [Clostridiales bacterium]|nr:hypothetical protein [Clostridiales bacterium]
MKILKNAVIIAALVLITIQVALFLLGYRMTIDSVNRLDWEAVGAIGTCLTALAIAFVGLSYNKRLHSIEKSNARVIKELTRFTESHKDFSYEDMKNEKRA